MKIGTIGIMCLLVLLAAFICLVGCTNDDDDDSDNPADDDVGDTDADDDQVDDDTVDDDTADDDTADDDTVDDDTGVEPVNDAEARVSVRDSECGKVFSLQDDQWQKEELPPPAEGYLLHSFLFSEGLDDYAAANYVTTDVGKANEDYQCAVMRLNNGVWKTGHAFEELVATLPPRRSPDGMLWAVASDHMHEEFYYPTMTTFLKGENGIWSMFDLPELLQEEYLDDFRLGFMTDGTPLISYYNNPKSTDFYSYEGIIYQFVDSHWEEAVLPEVSDDWGFAVYGWDAFANYGGRTFTCGTDDVAETGFVMTNDGSGWQLETIPEPESVSWWLDGVMLCGEYLWVVGSDSYTYEGYLWRYDGSDWVVFDFSPPSEHWYFYEEAVCDNEGDLWIMARGDIEFDDRHKLFLLSGDQAETIVEFEVEYDALDGFIVSSAGIPYAYGGVWNARSGRDGIILRYDGQEMVYENLPTLSCESWGVGRMVETSDGQLIASTICWSNLADENVLMESGGVWTAADLSQATATYQVLDLISY